MDKFSQHQKDAAKALDEFSPSVVLASLGITDLDIARAFTREFESELDSEKSQARSKAETDLVQKANLSKFTRISRLFISLKKELQELSAANFFEDASINIPLRKVKNQDIFTPDILNKRPGIANYISKAMGRCYLLLELFSNLSPKDEKIDQVLVGLQSWIKIFTEFSEILFHNSSQEYQKFQKNIENKREALSKIVKEKYTKNGVFQIPQSDVDKLLYYLAPQMGINITNELIDEYLETSLTLNSVRILGRLSEDSPVKEGVYPEEYFQGLNLIEVRDRVRNSYHKAYRVIQDKKINNEFKKVLLSGIDEELLEAIVPVMNKIFLIFPHLDESSGSTLIDYLSDENAICSGKTQIVRIVGDFLGLQKPKFATNLNVSERHTFNLFELPSSRTGILDCNFETHSEKRENIFTIRVMSEQQSNNDFYPLGDCLAFDNENGSYRYFKIEDINDVTYNHFQHRDFQILRSDKTLSPLTLANYYVHDTLEKFNDYIRHHFNQVEVLTSDVESYFSFNLVLDALCENARINEEAFKWIANNPQKGYSFETLVTMISLESLKNFNDNFLLEEIYLYLENLSVKNSQIFNLNYYDEKSKYEYLKQKLGKI